MRGPYWPDLVVSVAWGVVILAVAWTLKESPQALVILLILGVGATASMLALCCSRRLQGDQPGS